tara:strand:+ start:956 stop:1450 length:495 start_codon:yes stop_codon:yes gene_type:complete
MADEKIGPIPKPAMTNDELMELMVNMFTPGAGTIKTAGKVIPKIGKETIKILNKILGKNKEAIKNIKQSNKIREKLFKKAIEDKNFMKDLARRNPKMVVDAKRNFIGPSEELQKIAPRSSILKQLAKLSPLTTLQSDSELQKSFPEDDDLNFPSILEELISEPR